MNARLKYILKQVLPPVVVDTAKQIHKLIKNEPTALPELEIVPNDKKLWDIGWNHESIAAAQLKKWPIFLASVDGTRPLGWPHETPLDRLPAEPAADLATQNTIMSFAYVLGRSAIGKTKLSVLDWGGGIGHYFEYARRLYPEIEFDYTIKDMPAICRAGSKLQPGITFLSDDATALSQKFELVMCSSSLHYSRDFYGDLSQLCEAATRSLFVTRLPIVENSDEAIFIQRAQRFGYMTEYPAWITKRDKFISFVEDRGMKLDREFLLGDSLGIKNAIETPKFRGFLFTK